MKVRRKREGLLAPLMIGRDKKEPIETNFTRAEMNARLPPSTRFNPYVHIQKSKEF